VNQCPMKRPSFQFYPDDWLHETGLHTCSLAARRTLERPTLRTKVTPGEEEWWLMQQFIRLVNWERSPPELANLAKESYGED
jgi:hypothetical protein